MSVKVYDLGHARAGDKGNTSNVSVTAYDDRAWNILRELEEWFTAEGVATIEEIRGVARRKD